MVVSEKDKANLILGYMSVIGIAGMVGLIGGFLFGVWDCITVIIDRRVALNAYLAIFYLFIYSVSIYAVIFCLVMVVIGAAGGMIIKAGKYRINKSQLASVFIGIFGLLAVSALLSEIIMNGNIVDISESTLIGILSGVGLVAISIYILFYTQNQGIKKEKLIALFVSLFVPLLVLIYCGLLINLKLLSEEFFYQPISLVANIGLLILICLMGVGLYKLSSSVLQRYSPHGIRRAGYILLSVVLCAFIAVAFIGPFSPKASENKPMLDSGNPSDKPNILWIVMDTVRADHLSCYDYSRNTTPNIDRIASEGTLFENAISAAPWTLPSHASMFTGSHPSKHGTDTEHSWLDDDFYTVAEVLRMNGYRTYEFTNNPHAGPQYNLGQGFDTIVANRWGRIEAGSELADYLKFSAFKRRVQNNLRIDDGAQRTNEVVKEWIADSHKVETPFFIFINYMEAHTPYHPPQKYAAPYLGSGVDIAEALKVNQEASGYIAGKFTLSDEEMEMLIALYDGAMSYLDFKMGQLFDYLRELNILDNTVLIITADHGENFGEHQLRGHVLCVYDTLVHVPLIIRYPDLFEAGLRVEEQVQTTDIFPTILDITGIDWDSEGQLLGRSLLEDTIQNQSAFTIAEHGFWLGAMLNLKSKNRELDVSAYAHRLMTIRTNEFKYIWSSAGWDELYDIRNDPDELNNLIDTEPEKASELKALLKEWLNSFENYRPEAGP